MAFRSLDVSVTSVTAHVAHTTGDSDAEGYAESVLSVGAPSHLGPRSRSSGGDGAAAEVCCIAVTQLSSTPPKMIRAR